jgi:ATP-dependent DNA helicase PIF1
MIKLPNEFDWVDQSDETFSDTLEKILNSNDNLNIIGSAGSGKSLLIKIASSILRNVVVCSTTGISAVNLNSDNVKASTLHSFFQLEPLSYFPESKRIPTANTSKLLKLADVIIIDETSMLSSHLFDVITEMMLTACGSYEQLPRIILFSDIFQLPPVVSINDTMASSKYKEEYNDNIMFFNSKHFEDFNFKTIFLNRLYRQKDLDFQKILNRLRLNEQTYEDLAVLNKYVISLAKFNKQEKSYVYLGTTNKMVEIINTDYINNFNGDEYTYDYMISGDFDLKPIGKDRLHIRLKEGMQIMCTKNSYENSYRNGTIGIVTHCDPSSIVIDTDEGEKTVVESTIKQYEYYVNATGKLDCRVTGSFTQLDCKVSKAITVHKSQGQTLDSAYFNPGNYVFADGLVYVAISRLRSLEHFGLARPLTMKDIRINKESLKFYNKFIGE